MARRARLLAELLGVPKREKFDRSITIEEGEQYVAGLGSHAETLPGRQTPIPVARDDDYLIAFGRKAAANAVVSSDADLLVLERTWLRF